MRKSLLPPRTIKPSPDIRPLINIGALLDIPTGEYVKGHKGQWVLNGGLGLFTGVVGIGNNFKSGLTNYMMCSAASRVFSTVDTQMTTYDTEVNTHKSTLARHASRFESFNDRDVIADGTWIITDKGEVEGNVFYENLKEELREKEKGLEKRRVGIPFVDRSGNPMTAVVPTFGAIDSLTHFSIEAAQKMMDENELGESGGNTLFMKEGLAKVRLLSEMPALAGKLNFNMFFTAHVGKENAISSGPIHAPPPKKLQHLKHGDKIKGVTDKFTFLMSNLWHAYNAAPFDNQTTKSPEYPRDSDETTSKSGDLYKVTLTCLRSKSGPSGYNLELFISQRDGVLPSLSEFHFIKTEKFGLEGNDRNYALELLPDIKLSRTTVRGKLDEDPKLRRAMNITSELKQLINFRKLADPSFYCTPKELREDLIKQGYDWDQLFDTRGWWTYDDDSHPTPFLSTLDLLYMRKGLYKPYWLE